MKWDKNIKIRSALDYLKFIFQGKITWQQNSSQNEKLITLVGWFVVGWFDWSWLSSGDLRLTLTTAKVKKEHTKTVYNWHVFCVWHLWMVLFFQALSRISLYEPNMDCVLSAELLHRPIVALFYKNLDCALTGLYTQINQISVQNIDSKHLHFILPYLALKRNWRCAVFNSVWLQEILAPKYHPSKTRIHI